MPVRGCRIQVTLLAIVTVLVSLQDDIIRPPACFYCPEARPRLEPHRAPINATPTNERLPAAAAAWGISRHVATLSYLSVEPTVYRLRATLSQTPIQQGILNKLTCSTFNL